jgi:hypothetical protein
MSLSYPEILKGIVSASGDKNDIPLPAQAAGFASFAEGFGPINGLPLASGGIAPKREDINGFLNLLSQHNFWQQSGGMYTWANTLDYAVPAMVVGSDGVIYFALLASGPGTGAGYKDPTTQPTYWITLQSLVGSTLATLVQAVAGTSTTTALTPQGFAAANLSATGKTVAAGGSADVITATLASGLTALTEGMEVSVRMAYANATTTPTFNLTLGSTATGAYPIIKGALSALSIGDIPGSGFDAILKWNATASKWSLNNPSSSAAAPVVIQGAFKNLVLSSTGISALVSVSADEIIVKDSSGNAKLLSSVSSSASTASTGAGGLDTGTIAISTWYSVWVIAKTDGTTSILLSVSSTSPTMPSGYTFKARIGWVRTDGTANKYPLSFIQHGEKVNYKVASGSNVTGFPQITSGSTSAVFSPIGWASFAPPTAVRLATLLTYTGNSATVCLAPSANFTTETSSTTTAPPLETGGSFGSQHNIIQGDIIPESSNVYFYSNVSGIAYIYGWEDSI